MTSMSDAASQDEERKFARALEVVAKQHGPLRAVQLLTGATVLDDGDDCVKLFDHRWKSHTKSSALEKFIVNNGRRIAFELTLA